MEYIKISIELLQTCTLMYLCYASIRVISLLRAPREKKPKGTIFNSPKGSFFVGEKRPPIYMSEEKQWEKEQNERDNTY